MVILGFLEYQPEEPTSSMPALLGASSFDLTHGKTKASDASATVASRKRGGESFKAVTKKSIKIDG